MPKGTLCYAKLWDFWLGFLSTPLILIKDAGHFNEKAGYITFDILLKKIKELERE
jgi:hypothetical protein